MLPECSFAKATVRVKESLYMPRGAGIAVDLVIFVSSLKAVFSATGTSEFFVCISSSWFVFPNNPFS